MAGYKVDIDASVKKLLDKIQEQFGVSADRLVELAHADQSGRCAALPVKVGEIMWANISLRGDRYMHGDMPYQVKVVHIGIGEKSVYFNAMYSNGRVFPFDAKDIGRSVFYTADEAKAALRGRTQDGKA